MPSIPKTMRACVLEAYGKIGFRELAVPVPAPDEALCKIRAVAICGSDPKIMAGSQAKMNWPPAFPFVLGHEWAGEVAAVGEAVTGLKPGDRVAGEGHCGCGQCENCKKGDYTVCLNYGRRELGHRHYGHRDQGANAQYNAYRAKALARMPDSLDFAAGALCDTGGAALHGVELTGVTPGGVAVIYGPGPIGLCVLGIVKSMGSDQVIMVGRGHRLQTARELGADAIVDFSREDAPARILELTGGKGADEVFECSGAPAGPHDAVHSVRKGGRVALVGLYDDSAVKPLPLHKIVNEQIKIIGSKANPNVSDRVLKMLDKGVIGWRKIVSHRFPLDRYQEGVDLFVNRRDRVVKVVMEPWA
ncbi:MAG: alcohol dehydrogenase catalytic domain-containing protein [Planctomycetota bacterium]|jgi:L-iditol 2-dehydrogenase|nr:alcohol dehydrogenase catalytic domain-containing protein [Planctomycetota bacterium]